MKHGHGHGGSARLAAGGQAWPGQQQITTAWPMLKCCCPSACTELIGRQAISRGEVIVQVAYVCTSTAPAAEVLAVAAGTGPPPRSSDHSGPETLLWIL
jgi:hypothetical protein